MAIAYALSNNTLIPFDTLSPSIPGTAIAVTGIGAGEALVGIDIRPQNGKLYGLGVNDAANNATLYSINPQTGFAAVVGTAGAIAFVDGAANPVDLQGSGFGIDFNPVVDRLRIVTANGLNFRINPNTGAPIDGDNGGAAGSVAGTNPDGAINGGTTTVDATAYTNSFPNATATTQYTLDGASNSLFIQNPPNSGTQTIARPLTLGGTPLDFTSASGFDIPAEVTVATSNTLATGRALSLLTVGGNSNFYSIDLATGAATVLGNFGATPIQGLAVQNNLLGTPAIALNATGNSLLRFNTFSPSAVTTVAIGAGITAGETLVGIDFRPATGQLFGLGVNAVADTASVYIVDPQTGAANVVGVAGAIAFVNGAGLTIDLPASGYGIDFNPTVDRLRVTTDSGLNFRINPITGAPVDGDLNLGAGAVAGLNPDAAINGSGSTGVAGTAYTNSFGGATVTTQYTLDSTNNTLLIQNPPNSGTQTVPLVVRLDGSILDFTAANGFDIPGSVIVSAANTPALGQAFAALTVGASTNLYAINLANGNAISFGAIGTGAGISGLAIADAAPLAIESSNLVKRSGALGTIILGGSNPDVVFGTDGADTIVGFAGDDLLFGLSGNDSIDGGAGNDTILGGIGNDTLIGNIGNDTLIGSSIASGTSEIDVLIGGTGSDRFVIADPSGSYYLGSGNSNYALITDFNLLEDTIQIKAGFTLAPAAPGLPVGTSISQGGDLIAILAGVSISSLTAVSLV